MKILERGLKRCDDLKSEAFLNIDRENKKLLLKNIVDIKVEEETKNKKIEEILEKGFQEMQKKNKQRKEQILNDIEIQKNDIKEKEKEFLIVKENYLKNFNLDFFKGSKSSENNEREIFQAELKMKDITLEQAQKLAEKAVENLPSRIKFLKEHNERIKKEKNENLKTLVDRRIIGKLNKKSVEVARKIVYLILKNVYDHVNKKQEKLEYIKHLQKYLIAKREKIDKLKHEQMGIVALKKTSNKILEKIVRESAEEIGKEILIMEIKAKQMAHYLFAKSIFEENKIDLEDARILDIFQFVDGKRDFNQVLENEFEKTVLVKEEQSFVRVEDIVEERVRDLYEKNEENFDKDKEVLDKVQEACIIF